MRIARVAGTGFAVEHPAGGWSSLEDMGVAAASTADVIGAADEITTALRAAAPPPSAQAPRLLAPIVAPTKMLAIGLNYLDHIRETGRQPPERPILFAKFPNTINDPDGDVVVDA